MMTVKGWCLCLLVHLGAFTEGLMEEKIVDLKLRSPVEPLMTAKVELTRNKRLASPQIITGAVITSGATIVSAIIGEVGRGNTGNTGSGPQGGCKWEGTSGLFGACGSAHCPTKAGVERVLTEEGGNALKEYTLNGRFFGNGCWSGAKALCCKSKRDDNRWDGKWEAVSNGYIWRCTVRGENNRCNRRIECEHSHNRRIEGKIEGKSCNEIAVYCSGKYFRARGKQGKITFPRESEIPSQCSGWADQVWFKV